MNLITTDILEFYILIGRDAQAPQWLCDMHGGLTSDFSQALAYSTEGVARSILKRHERPSDIGYVLALLGS